MEKQIETQCSLNDFPNELLLMVFYYLKDIRSIIKSTIVCKLWRELLINGSNFWKKIFANNYNIPGEKKEKFYILIILKFFSTKSL